jgi:hypothetical protein
VSYSAIITKVIVRPHPNADRIALGMVAGGNQVVVSKETESGTIGIFFPTDGQLSHDFCVANSLYNASARAQLGLPTDSDTHFGFFDANRRVRAQKFRGEKSDGFWVPLNHLEAIGIDVSVLSEGEQLCAVGGTVFCEKYFTPATRRAMGKQGQGQARKESKWFPKHTDTTQFRFVADSLPQRAVMYITEKLHGTSGRFGYVLDEVQESWWRKLLRYIAGNPTPVEWSYLNGTRNVIVGRTAGPGFYGTNDFRTKAVEGLKGLLHKGEVIYFELVGWVNDETSIMPLADTEKLKKDYPELKQYASKFHYSYGCKVGECRLFVYRITMVNDDGVVTELSWQQMVQRCLQLGLEHVPLITGPFMADEAKILVEFHTDGPSTIDPTHIREGVVLRVESDRGTSHYKNKSHLFGVLEGIYKEKDDAVDLEEIS